MMNIHLSEVMMILLVALLVIKPERLPDIAFKVGKILAKMRQTLLKLKHEFKIND